MGAIADSIMAYAQPLLDQSDGSIEGLNKALALGQACWNLALLPEEERLPFLESFRKSADMSEAEFADFERKVIEPMIRRHEEMFPRLHQRGSMAPPHWDRDLELPSRSTARLPQDEPAKVGRYEPCPCNSGKKYKFCCGRGRG